MRQGMNGEGKAFMKQNIANLILEGKPLIMQD